MSLSRRLLLLVTCCAGGLLLALVLGLSTADTGLMEDPRQALGFGGGVEQQEFDELEDLALQMGNLLEMVRYGVEEPLGFEDHRQTWGEVERVQVPADTSCVAVDARDRLYLGGAGGVIQVELSGRTVQSLTTPGPVKALAFFTGGRLLVALEDRLLLEEGDELEPWPQGTEQPDYQSISGLAAGRAGIFVADSGARRVFRLGFDGELLGQLAGPAGDDPTGGLVLSAPVLRVALDGDSLLLNNCGRNRLERYSLDGRLLGTVGLQGLAMDRFSGCCNPVSFVVVDGGVVTAETSIPRVKLLSRRGELKSLVMPPAGFEMARHGFRLAADSLGRVYVLMPERGELAVFRSLEGEVAAHGR